MTVDRLRDLNEGELVYSERTDSLYRVAEIDAEFREGEPPNGTVEFNNGVATTTENAEDVDHRLHDMTLSVVDAEIIEDPEQILLDFAQEELKQYLSRLGINHEYNGIENAETLRDIKIANLIRRNSSLHHD